MKIIGINSGTSLDGVDIVLVEYNFNNGKIEEKLLFYEEYNYNLEFKEKLKKLLIFENDLEFICSMNFEIAFQFSYYINEFIKKYSINKNEVNCIASHGQTVWHNPDPKKGFYKSTLQLGDISALSYLTNIDVVGNFRTKDVASNGEGAPLMPVYDYFIHQNIDKDRAYINLGGISNVTYIRCNSTKEDVIAFDMGPANLLIDKACKRFLNIEYDKNGDEAKKGKIILPLFDFLSSDDYLDKPYPKSTGREKYSDAYFEKILGYFDLTKNSIQDLLYTLTYFTAYSIAYSLKKFKIDEILLSGGGALNNFLVSLIEKETKVKVYVDKYYKSKEAKLFAYLGFLYLNDIPGNLKSVTNADKYVILGNFSKKG